MKLVPLAGFLIIAGCSPSRIAVVQPSSSRPANGAAVFCASPLWETANESVSPPAAYVGCTGDADCSEQRMEGCCGSFRVAVNTRYGQCVAPRNAAAECVAQCPLPAPGWTPPARTVSCVQGACRLTVAGGAPRSVVAVPFMP